MAGKLKLIIYNETVSPGTNKIFEAQKLSWANILDIWDECVSFYEGKYYIIQKKSFISKILYHGGLFMQKYRFIIPIVIFIEILCLSFSLFFAFSSAWVYRDLPDLE